MLATIGVCSIFYWMFVVIKTSKQAQINVALLKVKPIFFTMHGEQILFSPFTSYDGNVLKTQFKYYKYDGDTLIQIPLVEGGGSNF